MDSIRTYAVGNGEITLTAQDAEELRRILQFEYIEGCIENIIENNPDAFRFTSEHNRSRFVSRVAEMHDDLVDLYGSYGECLDETVFHVGTCAGVVTEGYRSGDGEYDTTEFWKE